MPSTTASPIDPSTGNFTTPSGAVVNFNYGNVVSPPSGSASLDANTLSNPSPSISLAQPNTPSLYNISALPTLQPTGPQSAANGLSNDIEALTTQDAGKADYEIQQFKNLGLDVSTDADGNITPNDPALQDLNTQLTTLQNNAQAIPLQDQQGAEGRGITAAGLQPLDTGNLRNNAIQALTVSSLIAARQGKLATAQMMVNDAVTQKYGPIEAQLKAAQSNLQTIISSPAYSLADKQQAQDQQQAINVQQAQLDAAKTNYTNTQNEIMKYASVASPQALQALQQAQSPAQVAQIASLFGLSEPQAGRYKDSITTTTDAFGNQVQHVRVLDTLTGHFVDTPPGVTADTLNNAQPSTGGSTEPSSGTAPAPASSSPSTGSSAAGLSTSEYGLLANTDFNPNAGGQAGTIDQLAQNYLDNYLKNGTVPTASTLGRNMKPGGFAAVQSRAEDLYFQATGSHLPNPEVIRGYQNQLIANNNLLNNLNVQEGTIQANSALLLQNLNGSNLNQAAPVINGIIDGLKNAFGDPQVATFLAQNTTVANELGSLLALKNASGTTVHDKLEAAGIISSSDNADQIAVKVKILLNEAQNARTAIQGASANLYTQIDPLMQDPSNPARTQMQNQQFVQDALTKQGLNYDSLMSEMKPNTPPGYQPALDAKTGLPGFATPQEIQAGTAIPL